MSKRVESGTAAVPRTAQTTGIQKSEGKVSIGECILSCQCTFIIGLIQGQGKAGIRKNF